MFSEQAGTCSQQTLNRQALGVTKKISVSGMNTLKRVNVQYSTLMPVQILDRYGLCCFGWVDFRNTLAARSARRQKAGADE